MVLVVLLLLIPASFCMPEWFPVDCHDVYDTDYDKSGVYTIFPAGRESPVYVYCDMDSDGNWTVLQKRLDGSVNFYMKWEHYKAGFGSAAGEYWLGLDIMHLLTMRKEYEVRFDMEDFEGNKAFATYSSFSVGPESERYEVEVSGFRDGGAGDSFGHHNGHKFSTFDRDNDEWGGNCALQGRGAWWYASCHLSNPNGLYSWGSGAVYGTAVNWHSWRGHSYSLKAISMKIKPVA